MKRVNLVVLFFMLVVWNDSNAQMSFVPKGKPGSYSCSVTIISIRPYGTEKSYSHSTNISISIKEDTLIANYIEGNTIIYTYDNDSVFTDKKNPNLSWGQFNSDLRIVYNTGQKIIYEYGCKVDEINGILSKQVGEVEMVIYPNPSYSMIFLKESHQDEKAILLFNNQGIVQSVNYIEQDGVVGIDISSLQIGVYILQIGSESYKFLKQ